MTLSVSLRSFFSPFIKSFFPSRFLWQVVKAPSVENIMLRLVLDRLSLKLLCKLDVVQSRFETPQSQKKFVASCQAQRIKLIIFVHWGLLMKTKCT